MLGCAALLSWLCWGVLQYRAALLMGRNAFSACMCHTWLCNQARLAKHSFIPNLCRGHESNRHNFCGTMDAVLAPLTPHDCSHHPCRGHESNRDNFCRTMDAVEAALGEAEGPYFLKGVLPSSLAIVLW